MRLTPVAPPAPTLPPRGRARRRRGPVGAGAVATVVTLLLLLVFQVTVAAGGARAATTLPDRWWVHLNGERELGLRPYGKTLADAEALLPSLENQGYRVVNAGGWGINQGGPNDIEHFYGFAGVDYFTVDERLGTMEDWTSFLEAAHARGMAVPIWINLGYMYNEAPLFEQAEADVRTYGTNYADQPVDSPARWFLWTTNPTPLTDETKWTRDPEAENPGGPQVYYRQFWGEDLPAMNYAHPEWAEEAESILKFWLDTGVDGFMFDAPSRLLNITTSRFRALADVVHSYPNRLVGGETGCCGDDEAAGFDMVSTTRTDQTSATETAIRNNSVGTGDSGARGDANDRDDLQDEGLIAWGGVYVSGWNADDPGNAKGLLDVATHVAVGTHLHIGKTLTDPGQYMYGDFAVWPQGRVGDLAALLDAANLEPALATDTLRAELNTNDNDDYWAMLRGSGSSRVVTVLNYQGESRTVTVSLDGVTGLPSTTRDVLAGGSGPAISGGQLTVTLPAYGYGFYALDSGPAPVTVVDDADPAFSYGGGWNAYGDTNARGGTAHGGEVDGGFAEVSFEGTGVRVFGWQGDGGSGPVEVFVDGTSRGTFDQGSDTEAHQQQLFSVTGLADTDHTLRLVARTGSHWTMVDYVKVLG